MFFLTIFSTFLSIIVSLIGPIFAALPSLPPGFSEAMQTFTGYILDGVQILAYFYSKEVLTYIGTCVRIIIGIELFLHAWSICWWVIRKLPFFSVTD